ncbi:hypothetical protein [Lactobacillus taiwanensis]|uniref:hypothetical protein n=1 Tax=Lactobacillus taiwanensis TaxID=508451 RepID=UPI00242C065B|nr:hypothetical protein [Lactobacillus taiwanensis]
MANELDEKVKKLISKNKDNSNVKVEKKKSDSTFAKVYPSKSAPVQVEMDKRLFSIIGGKFLLISIDQQENANEKTGEIKTTSIYSVRVISRQAKAYRQVIQIKIKNAKPIIKDEELDKVMLELAKPILLRFDNIAHYSYIGGESLTASNCERLDMTVEEVVNNE